MKNLNKISFIEYERKPLLDSDISETTDAQKKFQNIQILNSREHLGNNLRWIEKFFRYATPRIKTKTVKSKRTILIKKILKLENSTLPNSLKKVVIQKYCKENLSKNKFRRDLENIIDKVVTE